MTTVVFSVHGVPAPQGSKSRMPNGAMVESSSATGRAKLANWRSACADAAADQADLTGCLTGPLSCTVEFRFAMPKSRRKSLRDAGTSWKAGKPDADKLERALGDSLVAGGLIGDDALIVEWHVRKVEVWQGWTGASILLKTIDGLP